MVGADAECDPTPESRTYVRWVRDLARVSRGGIALRSVREAWRSGGAQARSERPVEVHVEAEQGRGVLTPTHRGGYVVVEDLLDGLNALIAPGRPRLVAASTRGEDPFVVALTEPERRALALRGWRFADDEMQR